MKLSLNAQASALQTLRERGAVGDFARAHRLKDAERDYFEGALLAAAQTLRLMAEHENAIRELIREREAKR